MLILGKKGANLDQKGSKMGVDTFSRTVNLIFFKEDHKIGFYTKKPSKLNKQFGRYKLKCWFWAKKRQIWTKRGPKWAGLDFSGL